MVIKNIIYFKRKSTIKLVLKKELKAKTITVNLYFHGYHIVMLW